MDQTQLSNRIVELKAQLSAASQQIDALAAQAAALGHPAAAEAASHGSFFITGLTVFVLACFVGYYVVWRVTPALHSPLMAVTNAVSSVIIVGALIAAGPAGFGFSKIMGFLAVILASVNIFGGFLVTQRMLSMFKKKGK
ncbi:NAD(P) transhydrogenase subunit alpha [Azospirillum canadense]|uniref:NAD(P) transhydrogenase subunit alpha n=1 Tax=Azospirillum canadense TaxID=403962 RepID=UPI0022279A8E|nr:NAD(P) transhydrogenase subunit alpha [Azospirillum canadense]MCW2236306.1 NAD(P) transhydrogenase subunit alpha [Azospirillum canadense]